MTGVKYDFSLSVVIAVYNDQEVLGELYKRLVPVLEKLVSRYEIIFVDDASIDNSLQVLSNLANRNDSIQIVKLTRNFSQPNAISAGLDQSTGDVIVIMDSDLQDSPEDIASLITALLENNVLMAIAKRKSYKTSLYRRFLSWMFHAFSQALTSLNHERGLEVFRVLRREVLDELEKLPEKTGTTLSLLYWMGIDYVTVELDREARYAGKSGYTFGKLLKLSLDRIFSYSLFPIRLVTISGISLSLLSILLGLFYIFQKYHSIILPGWTSIVVLVLFLFGMNFFFLGIFGEYFSRIYIETRNRPRYVVDKMNSVLKSSNQNKRSE